VSTNRKQMLKNRQRTGDETCNPEHTLSNALFVLHGFLAINPLCVNRWTNRKKASHQAIATSRWLARSPYAESR